MNQEPGLKCQICALALNKREAEFVDEDTFAFLSQLPCGVSEGSYCGSCFADRVKPELDQYNLKLDQARNVNVFYSSQSKESRFVRRSEKPIRVEDCDDQDDVIMRLAFMAVEAKLNSLVDLDLTSVKVKNGKWQTSRWSGRAVPAQIDEKSLQRYFPSTPN